MGSISINDCFNPAQSKFRAAISAICVRHMLTPNYVKQHELKRFLIQAVSIVVKDQPAEPFRVLSEYFAAVASGEQKLEDVDATNMSVREAKCLMKQLFEEDAASTATVPTEGAVAPLLANKPALPSVNPPHAEKPQSHAGKPQSHSRPLSPHSGQAGHAAHSAHASQAAHSAHAGHSGHAAHAPHGAHSGHAAHSAHATHSGHTSPHSGHTSPHGKSPAHSHAPHNGHKPAPKPSSHGHNGSHPLHSESKNHTSAPAIGAEKEDIGRRASVAPAKKRTRRSIVMKKLSCVSRTSKKEPSEPDLPDEVLQIKGRSSRLRTLHDCFSTDDQMHRAQWIRFCEMFFIGWHDLSLQQVNDIFSSVGGPKESISFGTLQMALVKIAMTVSTTPAEVIGRLVQTALPLRYGMFIDGDEDFVVKALADQYNGSCKVGEDMRSLQFTHLLCRAGLVGGKYGFMTTDLDYFFYRITSGERSMTLSAFLECIPLLREFMEERAQREYGPEEKIGYSQIVGAIAFAESSKKINTMRKSVVHGLELQNISQFEIGIACYRDSLQSIKPAPEDSKSGETY